MVTTGSLGSPVQMCRLKNIEIAGFKCFRDGVVCGPLPGPGALVAVVGPNGCGKSVVGEAVAFVLGGNKKMLRASSLAALINQQRSAEGDRSAKVTICISGRRAASEATLLIERQLSNTRAETRVFQMEGGGTMQPQWRVVKEDELHHLLLDFGINTKAVDRYVVTQSRSAVDVQDPLRLVAHLEVLLGSSDLVDKILEQETLIREHNTHITCLEDEHERLQALRQSLVPEVRKFNSYQELRRAYQVLRQKLLRRKEAMLCLKTEQQITHGAKLKEKEDSLRSSVQAASRALEELEQQKGHILGRQKEIEKRLSSARALADKTDAEAAQLRAEIKHAADASSAAAELRKLAAKRLRELQAKANVAAAEEASAAAELVKQQEMQQWLQQGAQAAAGSGSDAGQDQEPQEDELAATAAALRKQLKEAQAQYNKQAKQAAELETSHKAKLASLAATEQEVQQHRELLQSATAQASALELQMAKARDQVSSLQHDYIDAQVRLHAADQAAVQAAACASSSAPAAGGPDASAAAAAAAAAAGGRWLAFDQTVQRMHSQYSQPLQPGHQGPRFFGRLCNVLHARDATHLGAVNAVLSEVASLPSTLVVADREAAYGVCAAIKEAHAGHVTCKVLAELKDIRQPAEGQARVLLPGGVPGVPLTTMVAAAAHLEGCRSIQNLVHSLLGGWAMVEDRATAMQVMAAQQQQQQQQQQRRQQQHQQQPVGSRGSAGAWSLVTRLAEVFKASGEIVARIDKPGSKAALQDDAVYELGASAKPLQPPAAAAAEAPAARLPTKEQRRQRQQLEQGQREAARRKAAIQEESASLEQAVMSARAQLRDLTLQHQKQQEQAASESRAAAAMAHRAAAFRQELERSATGACGDSEAGLLADLKLRICELEEQLAAATRRSREEPAATKRGGQPPNTASELRKTGFRISKALSELQRCQKILQRLQQQVATQAQAVQQMEQGPKQESNEVQMKARYRRLLVQAEKHAEESEGLEDKKARMCKEMLTLTSSLEHSRACMDDLKAELASAQAQAAKSSNEVRQLQESLAAIKFELARLPEIQDADVASRPASDAAMQQGKRSGPRRQTRASVCESSSSSSSSSSEEEESVQNAKRSRRRLNSSHSRGTSLADEESRVADEESALAERKEELELLKQAINSSALKEDLDAMNKLAQIGKDLEEHGAKLELIKRERERLADERHSLLSKCLQVVNVKLSQVYQFLTSWVGDAHLQYTSDIKLLSATGVTLCVRPDQHRWQAFMSLSGGQQALATLALAFAMQAAFPSPFYFFDEVDAALDTLAAERVADYMLMCSRGDSPIRGGSPEAKDADDGGDVRGNQTQYICVSHKPQVFEKADCLVGLYTCKGTSLAVTSFFNQAA